MPIKMLHTSLSTLSQLHVIYFAVGGAYFVYFMFAVALFKTAAAERIRTYRPGKSEIHGCNIYDKECECTQLNDKAAMPAVLLLSWHFV